MSNALIVGFGRAGKRQAQYAEKYGYTVATVDPYVANAASEYTHYRSLQDALVDDKWDIAVVCTPPALHIEQIDALMAYKIPTLCEKPLCALGQLDDAADICAMKGLPVMMAFNYRYHPNLKQYRNKAILPPYGWELISENYRPSGLPAWGLLLDHVSHAMDIMSWMSHGISKVEGAFHDNGEAFEEWVVWGKTERYGDFKINEKVWKYEHVRKATLVCPHGNIDIDANADMFDGMWKDFVKGEYKNGLAEGFETQYWLEEANRLAK